MAPSLKNLKYFSEAMLDVGPQAVISQIKHQQRTSVSDIGLGLII